jgi:hypothetical protein
MLKRFVTFVAGFGFVTMISLGAWAAQNAHPARPGSINYVEGNASIGTQALGPNSAGSVELEKDRILTTEAGKVEILLTPGVFLRVADYSSVRMVSPGLAYTAVAIEKGRAAVEVVDIHNENDIRISLNDISAKLLNKGLYDFDADQNEIRVFKGKAEAYVEDRKIILTRGRELCSDENGAMKPRDFDSRQYEDDLFRWSALRSAYLSEASVDQARVYVGMGPGWYGPYWYGAGWYWNPNFFVYTFLPANGIFYSPFGWRFYSPIIVYRSPFFYRGFGPGPHRFEDFRYRYGHGFDPRRGLNGGFHGPAARGRR